MVRTQGGQGMKFTIREDGVPLVGHEHPINSLRGWMSTLIAPCIKVAIEVHFLQRCIAKEVAELAH
jgi:hypothetical protein